MKWTKEHLTDLRCKMTTEKGSQQQNTEIKVSDENVILPCLVVIDQSDCLISGS